MGLEVVGTDGCDGWVGDLCWALTARKGHIKGSLMLLLVAHLNRLEQPGQKCRAGVLRAEQLLFGQRGGEGDT